MIFRILGDYFNQLLEDDQGNKVYIGQKGLAHLSKFPFKEKIVEGAPIIVCDGELQVEAILEFDEESKDWFARLNWSTRRDLISPADGLEVYKDASPEERLAILKYESEIYLEFIHYYAKEFSRINDKSIEDLPELFFFWAKELLRSTKTVKDMMETLT